MKKVIIAAALTAMFTTVANAHSGLADRVNEERSYPTKTVEKADTTKAIKNTIDLNRPEY